jgi:hypothetical protein
VRNYNCEQSCQQTSKTTDNRMPSDTLLVELQKGVDDLPIMYENGRGTRGCQEDIAPNLGFWQSIDVKHCLPPLYIATSYVVMASLRVSS